MASFPFTQKTCCVHFSNRKCMTWLSQLYKPTHMHLLIENWKKKKSMLLWPTNTQSHIGHSRFVDWWFTLNYFIIKISSFSICDFFSFSFLSVFIKCGGFLLGSSAAYHILVSFSLFVYEHVCSMAIFMRQYEILLQQASNKANKQHPYKTFVLIFI